MKLNAEQIKKALECCASEEYICTQCPIDEKIKDDCECGKVVARNALSLITSQEQRIKELTEENERFRAEQHEHFEKWLKLEEATKRHHSELFEEAKIVVKEDTVRKMQERLKEYYHFKYKGKEYVAITDNEIDQIAKEMLEGKE